MHYKDWKVHFVVQNHGGCGPPEERNALLLFNLRRDRHEKVAEESGMHVLWMEKNIWTFGPTKNLIRQHLMTFKAAPPRGASVANPESIGREAVEENGLAQ